MDAHGRAPDQEMGAFGLPETGSERLGLGDGALRGMQGVESVEFGEIEPGGRPEPLGELRVEAASPLVARNVQGRCGALEVREQGLE